VQSPHEEVDLDKSLLLANQSQHCTQTEMSPHAITMVS